MTVEISTYHSLISSSYTLHQPNPWKIRVGLSKPCFEFVSAKKQILVNNTFDEAASPQSAKKDAENL